MRAVDTLAVIRDGTLDAYGPRDQVLAKLGQAQVGQAPVGQAPPALQATAPRAA
jgi:ABC-type protease/lipase transport system fused ATPase/permease subunit